MLPQDVPFRSAN